MVLGQWNCFESCIQNQQIPDGEPQCYREPDSYPARVFDFERIVRSTHLKKEERSKTRQRGETDVDWTVAIVAIVILIVVIRWGQDGLRRS